MLTVNIILITAVVVAQLVEQLLTTTEDCGSNPVMGKLYITCIVKSPGMARFLTFCFELLQ